MMTFKVNILIVTSLCLCRGYIIGKRQILGTLEKLHSQKNICGVGA